MDTPLESLATRIIAANCVFPDDTTALRQALWAGGLIDVHGADCVFAINRAMRKSCPQWVDLFVESISAYLLEAMASPVGRDR